MRPQSEYQSNATRKRSETHNHLNHLRPGIFGAWSALKGHLDTGEKGALIVSPQKNTNTRISLPETIIDLASFLCQYVAAINLFRSQLNFDAMSWPFYIAARHGKHQHGF